MGDARRWAAPLAVARETPQSLRAWATRQSYAATHPAQHRMAVWHANTVLWYGASYLHFNDREILGIWLGAIHLSDAGTAEIEGGSAMCMMGMQQSTCFLRRVDGHWQVVRTTLNALV